VKIQTEVETMTTETLKTTFKNNKLNESEKTIINEIFIASHFSNSKNRKYSENWIL